MANYMAADIELVPTEQPSKNELKLFSEVGAQIYHNTDVFQHNLRTNKIQLRITKHWINASPFKPHYYSDSVSI